MDPKIPVFLRLTPRLGSSLPSFCFQPILFHMGLIKERPDGIFAVRMLCGLGGSPFLYPLEPYK